MGQGLVGLATKTSAAVLGLAAFPAQGLSRSIRAAAKCETKRINWKEGEWLVTTREFWNQDYEAILENFEGLKGRKQRKSKSDK